MGYSYYVLCLCYITIIIYLYILICRCVLSSKLERHGITGRLLNWITNCISKGFVNGTLSNYGTMVVRIPQGSFLGPFLFLVYLNNIGDELNCVARLTADDTSLTFSSNDSTIIESNIKEIYKNSITGHLSGLRRLFLRKPTELYSEKYHWSSSK